ncbi:acyl transferase domain-containing protein/acyl carrier protein/thioesterase domain-containing protein, partial [Streptomyces sp. V2I9]|nr:acyl transferase domain-containing protein/acyl carrier protein/thioesterase domain-containing protein [Streptomyces sp. V2I9]
LASLTGVRTALELGPAGVLCALAQEQVDSLVAAPALRPERPEPATLARALACLHTRGVPVDWPGYLAPFQGARITLPTYPFARRRYWPTPVAAPRPVAGDNPAEREFWAAVDSTDTDAVAGALHLDDEQRDGLGAVLPALAAWRERSRHQATTDAWRYRVGWSPVTARQARLTGTWILVTGGREVPGGVVDGLRGAGADLVELTELGANRTECAGTLAALASDATERDRPVAGLLACLDTAADLLCLIQAQGDAGLTAPLWCLTSGAVAVAPGEACDPSAAQLWGLGRVAALEHPDRWGGLVDVPAHLDRRAADRLVQLLAADAGEDQAAIRPTGLHARRLRRAPTGTAARTPAAEWHPDGPVLVTGGTGALGGKVARLLAERGATRLVVASRRGPAAPGAPELVAELAERGCDAVAVSCDLGDRDAVARLLEHHPVTAVVHAAGIVDDGVLDTLTPQRLAAVLDAKAHSADLLDELTGELTDFVAFSSVAGVIGSAGQGPYAAANAHLDALVERRRARGLPGTALAWGAWAGAGMAADPAAAARLARGGLPAMEESRALEALTTALTERDGTVVVADIDWERFVPGFTAVRPSRLFAELPEAAPVVRGVQATGLVARAAPGADAAEQARDVEHLVLEAVAGVLGHGSPADVDRERAFHEMGFDSLTALELRNLLASRTGLALHAGLVFDFPTPGALAEHLLTLLSGQAAAPDAPPAGDGRRAADDEPIAIIGMSCRFPGGADSPEALWRLVRDGVDAMGDFPADRGWDLDALLGNDGPSSTRSGGFLDDLAAFDAGLFGISPHEALAMDPQQRLLLETSWEAFERAGIDPTSVRGSETGVFAGTNGQDYLALLLGSEAATEGHLGTGNSASVLSGRVSYTFGLRGPALSVDTACSSSLVALHLAARSLRAGECSMALAGGVTAMPLPGTFIEFSTQGALSADGRCKAFSADADGTGWGEGVGLLLLERLSDARRNGHRVLAVVRGSAVNQDGASNGLTAPNGPSQERVIRAALADARLTAADVDAVEAHGTGTRLGDPIEAQALLATYGQDRQEPLYLGSLKSNIGHTQAAAGVAGVIKMVQALQHGTLPATLHVQEPSSQVDWSAGAVELLTDARPWPRTDRPRRAGVSSFGMSGTNAHVILEAAPRTVEAGGPAEGEDADGAAARKRPPGDGGPVPWLLSGRSGDALRGQAERLLSAGDADPADVAWSLATGRAVLERRAVLLGPDHTAQLRALAAGDEAAGVVRGTAVRGGTVFVFPGQGSQWAGMTAELLEQEPVFAARMEQCHRALEPFTDFSLLDVVRGEGADLERVEVVQPVLWAVMVSLAELWASAGVHPSAVVGHSQGEIAAAVVAGALSLEDGARVVALRARAIADELAGCGGMVSLAVSRDTAQELTGRWEGLSVAAVNGPGSTVVSGNVEGLQALVAHCAAAGIRARRLPVDYASHSAHVERLRPRLLADLRDVDPAPAAVPFYSTLTGTRIDTSTLGAEYWYDNLRATVRCEDATRALLDDGNRLLIEISPHPVLTVGLRETLDDTGLPGAVLSTLRRGEGGRERWLTALAEAHVRGVAVDWEHLLPAGRPVDLPTYAFARDRYWPDAAAPLATAPADGPAGTDRAEQAFWNAVESGDTAAVAGALGVEAPGLDQVLPALAGWRRARRQESTVDSRRYEVTWRPLVGLPSTAPAGRWMLALPQTGAEARTETVRTALSRADVTEILVPTGTGRDELAAVLAQLPEPGGFTGVVSLLAFAEPPHPGDDVLAAGTGDTVTLLQALGDTGIGAPLWCLTRGAVTVGRFDTAVDGDGAMLWGLGRVAALEHPERWGGLIDLCGSGDTRSATRLGALLAGAAEDEDQLAVRPSGVFTRRVRRAAPEPAAAPWTPGGPVLVTGGTGALGREVARWLARRGVTDLLLVSRSGPDAPGVDELVAEVAGIGATATVAACDVTDRAALAALLERHPVTGVVHTAGVSTTAPLATTSPAEIARDARAKVLGAVHLDALLGDRADLFVLFSSIAGIWGGGGQAAYAAANAHLDALAERRRAHGRAATAVAWGAWDGGGMVTDRDAGDYLRDRGIAPMPPELCLAALASAVDSGRATGVFADIDWDRFVPTFTARRPSPLVGDLEQRTTEPTDAPDTATAGAEGHELRTRLQSAGAADRHRLLLDLVRTVVATVLGHPGPRAVDPDRAFTELGIDSLTALRVRDGLSAATGLRLPGTLVFDHPTARVAAAELLGLLGVAEPAAAPGTPPPAARAGTDDPVVIVSMSCRYPGGADSPENLWKVVEAGTDAMSPFPADRGWDLSAAGGFTAEGGFLHDATAFDADLFGISPREAVAMDPHQRLLLESAWELLERGGIAPTAVRGTRTGVFVGASAAGYAMAGVLPEGSESHAMTGSSNSVLSGRISYIFGLEGPAVTVDTACSSSLVALHLAAQSLRNGECSMALAGGVTVMHSPVVFAEFGRQGGLASDGRCHSFAASADGTGWGEGVGLLLLERLSDARRNGHRVLGVLRGSAVNQDGASNGLTAPNGPAQQRVIRAALAAAGLETDEVDAVEAHGTGTRLGDPIEAQALLATYGQNREEPLYLGSVKSNIGHTQAASGVAGVIKTIEAIRRGVLPRTLHVDEPTPEVDWSAGAVELLTDGRPWPHTGRARRAGVSSFGISGTNAHVIIEEAPHETANTPRPAGGPDPAAPLVLWPVSGRSEAALRAQADRLRSYADRTGPALDLHATARQLATARAALEHRAVVLAPDAEGLHRGLAQLAGADGTGAETVRGEAGRGDLAFVFSGQGAQRAGMGRELYETYPVFADAFDAVCAHLDPDLDRPLREVVLHDADALGRTAWTQLGLFAFEVALYRLLESWSLAPDRLTGHSVGEIAAAHVAGVLPLADACTLVSARARLMGALPEGGAMMSVRMTEAEACAALSGYEARAAVAAVNSRDDIVLSGDADALAELAGEEGLTGRRVRFLDVSHAFHSPRMDPVQDDFAAVAASLHYHPARIPLVSTVTGLPDDGSMSTPEYWVRQIRATVRFRDAVNTLLDQGVTRFAEIGPGAALTVPLERTLEHARSLDPTTDTLCVALQRSGGQEPAALLTAVARLHTAGVPIGWDALLGPATGPRPDLPTYAFQRRRYWPEPHPAPAPDAARTDRHQVTWRPLPEPEQAVPHGTWLAVTAGDRSAAGLLALLREQGMRVTEVPDAGGSGETRAEALRRACDDDPAVTGVLCLAAEPGDVLTLARTLGDIAADAPLWCLTTGAVATGPADPPAVPARAAVWGLGRTLGLEAPHRWGGLVDLPAHPDPRTAARLAALLAAGGAGEDQIALRATPMARRIVTAPPPAAAPWQPSGTVLVTGGTGRRGRALATALASDGAEHLILLGRRGAEAPGAREFAESLPVDVTFAAADVTDRAAVTGVLAAIPAGRPLTAVFHAVGAGEDTPWTELDPGDLHAAAAADGARVLHEVTRELTPGLRAFVLLSSVTGVWGGTGAAVRAAEGARMDALAAHRHSLGLPATSVSFGPWATGEENTAAQRLGLRPLDPGTVWSALREAVAAPAPCAVVADVDWERFHRAYTLTRHRPLFDELPPVRALSATVRDPEPQPAAAPGLTGPDRHRAALDLVRDTAATVLGHTDAAAVAPDRQFLELGVDSLAALEIRGTLERATGLSLPGTVVFDHPTPAALARHLAATAPGGGSPAGAEPAVTLGISPTDRNPVGLLDSLYREAVSTGRIKEFLELVGETAKFRPTAADVAQAGGPAALTTLADGPAPEPLICVSGLTAGGGPQEFVRLAAPLRGTRPVAAVPVLGYGRGELLPATAEVALDWQARGILAHAQDTPVVLFGHSGGAVLAHRLAVRLTELGAPPAGLVLADIYRLDDPVMADWSAELSEGVFDRAEQFVPMDDSRLTAMTWYGGLFWEAPRPDSRIPTLLLRASRPLREPADGRDWRSSWKAARDIVDVPGDHFTMMAEHAGTTARAVHRWIEELPR